MDSENPHDSYTDLGRQAKAAFKRGQTFESLIFNLNEGTLSATTDLQPGYYNNQALARTFLVKHTLELNWVELHNWLTEENRASTVGFNTDKFTGQNQAPDRTTLSRAWNNRFSQVQEYIQHQANHVQEIAAEQGNPLASPLQPDQEDSSGSSERTQQRLLRSKTQDVLDELETLVFPSLTLDRPEEPIYNEEELLTLEALLGITNSAANDGSKQLGDKKNPNPDLDDPFTEDGPTGETLLEAIKPLSVDKITETFNHAVAKIFTRSKVKDQFNVPVTLAIDVTYIGYYADEDEIEWVTGAPESKEYDWCFRFATAAIVDDNTKFTVALKPVGHPGHRDGDAYPGGDQNYRVGEIFRDLLDIATEHIRIDTVVADREFYAVDVIAACESHGLFYVIPAVRNIRVKKTLERVPDKVTVKEEYGIFGSKKHGASNERVETTLVVLPEEHSDRGGPAPFITNLEVDDEIGWDRERTKEKIERYQARGAIETSYKKIKEFAAWTTSKAFEVRLYHFGMAVVLYNTWLLVDFLVQIQIELERRSKPRVSAARFLRFLDDRLDKLIAA